MIRFALVIYCTVFLAGCVSARTPLPVMIPEGYTGWVRIEYGVPGEPALRVERGTYGVTVPHSGIFRTSSPFETGFASDEYYYVATSGQSTELKEAPQPDDPFGMIRARKMFAKGVPGQKERTFGAFFVGPLSAYQSAPKDPASLPLP